MDQAVYETLLRVTDSDGSIRSAAESRLKELALAPEYPVSLARLTVSQEFAVPQRQISFSYKRHTLAIRSPALSLKTYVTTHWSPKNDEKFIGPEPPQESKSAVRELIVRGLADRESKIRVVSAYVVSKIAHDDFPEDWPNLFDVLLSYIKSNNADSVHGAMRVLLEMVKKDISIQQLPQVGPVLIPELFTILTSENLYSFRTRGRAVDIFSSCVQMMSTLREENPTLAEQLIAPIIPQWAQAFNAILNHHVQGDAKKATEEYGLKMEVVKCICTISGEFPTYVAGLLPQLFEPIWMDLYNLRERYVTEFVSDSDDIAESFQDSDGNEIGFQSLLYVLFDFVSAACTKKTVSHLFVTDGNHTGFFEQLLYVYIVYMQITQEQAETWSTDANQYVADEEDGTFSFNARVAAIDVLVTLQDRYPVAFFNALSAAVGRHITESNEARAAGNSDWWKIQEACLLAIGRLSTELMEALDDESHKVQFDLKSLFDHVVLNDMKAAELPFLQGRAFVFASEFAKILPADMASQYVAVAVNALQSPISGIPVKISALRALNNYCKFLDPQHINPYQVNFMEGTCQLLPSATEESLMLLLDTLSSSISINSEVTAQYEHVLTPAVLEIWKKFPSDSIITSYVLDVVEQFAKIPVYYPALCARALPLLNQVLATPGTEPIVYSSAMDLLTAMVRFGPSPLPDEFTEQMFPVVMQLAWSVPDNELLQSAQDCLKQFVMKDCDHIVRWRDPSGKTGLDYIIHFVAKVLQPSTTESDPIFVGDLIITLIQKAGHNIAPVLPDLLNAVLSRLDSTSFQPFIQSLVLVFAHLIINQQDTTLQFLSSTNVNGKSGLEILMPIWCDYYDGFSGYYSIKVSAIALSKIFLINDPRLQDITVKGEIVVNPNAGIVTRSKAKRNPDQYTAIPLHAKIIKLLVADLGNNLTGDQAPQEDVESVGEEDGDWEDVEDDAYGAGNFNLLSDILANMAEEDDDEENNPDLKNDPIYQTDMKSYLIDFFRNCSAHNVNHFMEICHNQLNETEKHVLDYAVSN